MHFGVLFGSGAFFALSFVVRNAFGFAFGGAKLSGRTGWVSASCVSFFSSVSSESRNAEEVRCNLRIVLFWSHKIKTMLIGI